MAPPVYKDFGKAANDLLTKDFPTGHKLELVSKTSNGVTFTSTIASGKDGKITGTFEDKYTYAPRGLTFTGKFDVDSGKFTSEVQSTSLLEGLKVTVNGETDLEKLKGSVEYGADRFNVTGTFQQKEVTGSAVFSYEKFLFGGSFKYGLEKGNTNWEGGVTYRGADFDGTFKLLKEASTASVNYNHRVNDDFGVAVQFNIDLPNMSPELAIASSYKFDSDATGKAKIDTEGKFGISYKQKLNSAVTLTLGSNIDLNGLNGNGHQHGFQLNINA